MSRILVLGGSGFVGRALCRQLAARGARVTVPTRGARVLALPGIEPVTADVTEAGALEQLLPGHDVVVNLIAILHGRPAAFEALHAAFPARLAAAAAAAGVGRLVHVSALGADPAGPSHYQRSKGRGEAALAAAAASTRLPVAILRPSVIFGAEDRFLNLFARLQRFAPFLPLAGAGARFQPVWVEDVARALVVLTEQPLATGAPTILEACGPTVYTLAELVRYAGRAAGHPRPILPLPLAIGRLQALLMEYLPGKTLMSRDNVDSLRVDNVASGTVPGLAALGLEATALEGVLRAK